MPRGEWRLTWFWIFFEREYSIISLSIDASLQLGPSDIKNNSIIDLLAWQRVFSPISLVIHDIILFWSGGEAILTVSNRARWKPNSRMRGSLLTTSAHPACSIIFMFLTEIHLNNPTYRYNLVSFHDYMWMACWKSSKIDGNRRIDEKKRQG